MDEIREKFTFSTDAVLAYELGNVHFPPLSPIDPVPYLLPPTNSYSYLPFFTLGKAQHGTIPEPTIPQDTETSEEGGGAGTSLFGNNDIADGKLY